MELSSKKSLTPETQPQDLRHNVDDDTTSWEDERKQLISQYEDKISDLQSQVESLRFRVENSESLRKKTETSLISLRKEMETRDEQLIREIAILKIILNHTKQRTENGERQINSADTKPVSLTNNESISVNSFSLKPGNGNLHKGDIVKENNDDNTEDEESDNVISNGAEDTWAPTVLLKFTNQSTQANDQQQESNNNNIVENDCEESKKRKRLSSSHSNTIRKKRRGYLPSSSTSMLRQWLNDHKLYPYPSEGDKMLLCQKTDLTMIQINNWFTNARRELKKKQNSPLNESKRVGITSVVGRDGIIITGPSDLCGLINKRNGDTYNDLEYKTVDSEVEESR